MCRSHQEQKINGRVQIPSDQGPMASELPQGPRADAIAGITAGVDMEAGRTKAPNNHAIAF